MSNDARSAARRRLEGRESTSEGHGPRTVNLPEGAKFLAVKSADPRRFDILNYDVTEKTNPFAEPGDKYFERTYYRHGGLGPDDKGMAICLQKTYGEACPVCEYLKSLDWNNDAEQQIIKTMKHKERQLFNVYDVADPDAGIQVWDMSYHLFGKMLDAELKNADEEDEVDNFSDRSLKGKTLKIAFDEETMGKNSYFKTSSINFKNRATDHTDAKVVNLDKCVGHPTYAEVKAIMDGSGAAPAETKEEKTEKPAEGAEFVCPGGGTYGKDCDKFGKTCTNCPKWIDCEELTEA